MSDIFGVQKPVNTVGPKIAFVDNPGEDVSMLAKKKALIFIVGFAWLLFGSFAFCQETPKAEESTAIEAKLYRDFGLGQQALLAAATVFKPESAQNANVKYFHPIEQLKNYKETGDDKEIGVKLANGKFVVIEASATHVMGVHWRIPTESELKEVERVLSQKVTSVGLVSGKRRMIGSEKGIPIIHWAGEQALK